MSTEVTVTAQPARSPSMESHTAYLAERCASQWEKYRRDREKASALRAALAERVDAETFRAIQELIDADSAATTSWAWALVDEMARHLPMVAPVLPGLLEHVADQHRGDAGRCCVVADAPLPIQVYDDVLRSDSIAAMFIVHEGQLRLAIDARWIGEPTAVAWAERRAAEGKILDVLYADKLSALG